MAENIQSAPNTAASQGPDSFHPASPLTKADVLPAGIDGVTRTTTEHHTRRGRPPADAPRKMDVHKPRRSRGYETTHKNKQTQARETQELGYPSDVGALLVEPPSEQQAPRIIQPKKEGEPVTIPVPDKTESRPAKSPLETVAKESSPPQPSQNTKEAQADDPAKVDETKGEKKPTAKAKRPSVAKREFLQRAQGGKPEISPAGEVVEVADQNLPEDWKVEAGRVELPDGRRIVLNSETGKAVIVLVKDSDGNELSPEDMVVRSAKEGESNSDFLEREISFIDKEIAAKIESQLKTDQQTSKSTDVITPDEVINPDERKAIGSGSSKPGELVKGPGQEVEPYDDQQGGVSRDSEGRIQLRIGMTADSERRESRQLGRERLVEEGQADNRDRIEFIRRVAGDNPSRFTRAALGLVHRVMNPIESTKNWVRHRLVDTYTERRYADEAIDSGEVQRLLDAEKFSVLERLALFGGTPDATELIHEGESLVDADNPELIRLGDELRASMRQYIQGATTEDDFREAVNRSLVGISWMESRRTNGAEVAQRIDNIQEVADHFRLTYLHAASMEEIDAQLESMELVVGEVQMGARTEVEGRDASIDKAIEYISGTPVGRFANEATIAAATTVVYGVGRFVTQKLAGKATAFGTAAVATTAFGAVAFPPALLAGAAVASVVAYYRERHMSRADRTMVARQRALGEQDVRGYEATAPRRAEIQANLYDLQSASEMTEYGQDTIEIVLNGLADPALTTAERDTMMANLAAMYVRNRTLVEVSDVEKIDLIMYQPGELEQQRMLIDQQTAIARRLLENYAASNPAFLADQNVTSVDELINQGMDAVRRELYTQAGGIDERDRASASVIRKDALGVAALTFGGGLLAGGILRELVSLKTGGPGAIGAEEVKTGGYTPETAAAAAAAKATNEIPYGGAPQDLVLGKNIVAFAGNELRLPNGLEFKPLGNGNFAIQDLRSGETIVDQVTLDPSGNGALSAETADALRSHGVMIAETHGTVDLGPITHTMTVPEYIQANPDQFTTVTRSWEHNLTTFFDKNELRGHIRVEGDQVVFDMSHMTPEGSYNQFGAVNAVEGFQSGRAHFLFSLDADHQSTPLDIPVNPDGTVSMPIDSDLTRSLIDVHADGTWDLKTAYWEVALDSGKTAPNGSRVFDILATAKGDNSVTTVNTSVPNLHETTQTVLDVKAEPIPIPDPDGSETIYVVDPWFVPIVTRRLVENIRPGVEPAGNEVVIRRPEGETPGNGAVIVNRDPNGTTAVFPPPPPPPPSTPPPGENESNVNVDTGDIDISGGETTSDVEVNNGGVENDISIDNSDEVNVEVVNGVSSNPENPAAPGIVINFGNITNTGGGPIIIHMPINVGGTQTANQTITIGADGVPAEVNTDVDVDVAQPGGNEVNQNIEVDQTAEATSSVENDELRNERVKRLGREVEQASSKLAGSLLIAINETRLRQNVSGNGNVTIQAGGSVIVGDEALRSILTSVRGVAESTEAGEPVRADISEATAQTDTLSNLFAGIEGEAADQVRVDLENLQAKLRDLESYVSGRSMTLNDVVSVAGQYVRLMRNFGATFGVDQGFVASTGESFDPDKVLRSIRGQIATVTRGGSPNPQLAQDNLRLIGEIYRIYTKFIQDCANTEWQARVGESTENPADIARGIADEIKTTVEGLAGAESARERIAQEVR